MNEIFSESQLTQQQGPYSWLTDGKQKYDLLDWLGDYNTELSLLFCHSSLITYTCLFGFKSFKIFGIECLLNIWVPIGYFKSWVALLNTSSEPGLLTTEQKNLQLRSAAIFVSMRGSNIISETSAAAVCRDHETITLILSQKLRKKTLSRPKPSQPNAFERRDKNGTRVARREAAAVVGVLRHYLRALWPQLYTTQNGISNYHCSLCSFEWTVIRNGPNDNIVCHDRMKHAFTFSRVKRLKKSNASKDKSDCFWAMITYVLWKNKQLATYKSSSTRKHAKIQSLIRPPQWLCSLNLHRSLLFIMINQ